jgi:zinc transport system substrate-binding protein
MPRWSAIIACFISCFLVACAATPATPVDRLQVVTTLPALTYIAQGVAGGAADVQSILPPGADPHTAEPSPQQVALAFQADILVLNGGGLEPWLEDVVAQLPPSVTVLRAISFAGVLQHVRADEQHDDHGHEEDPHEGEGEAEVVDPHVWLDPTRLLPLSVALRDALTAKSPLLAEAFRTGQATVAAALIDLDASYQAALATCEARDLIVAHNAYGYLVARYQFRTHPIAGLSPEDEPSAATLALLTKEATELGATTIFFEGPASQALAQTLAQEVGATTAVLSPLETLSAEQVAAGATYVSVMRENLSALTRALRCS